MIEQYIILPTNDDIRAARNYLNWSQTKFAKKIGLNLGSVTKIESGKQKPTIKHLKEIAEIFFKEGIRFNENGGFYINKSLITIYEGINSYQKVMEDVLLTCSMNKEEVLYLGSNLKRATKENMEACKKLYKAKIPQKYLISETDDYIFGPLEDYRQINKDFFLSKNVITIYDNKIAFFAESEGDSENSVPTIVKIIIIKSPGMTKQYKAYFYRLWNKGKIPTKSSAEQTFFKK